MRHIDNEFHTWALETFGLYPFDTLYVRKDVMPDKQKDRCLMKIVLYVKKKFGVRKEWLDKETVEEWRRQLKTIVGDCKSFDLVSTEAHEVKALEITPEEMEPMKKGPMDIYNYKFTLTVMKYISEFSGV